MMRESDHWPKTSFLPWLNHGFTVEDGEQKDQGIGIQGVVLLTPICPVTIANPVEMGAN
jgi:hypothetical protein